MAICYDSQEDDLQPVAGHEDIDLLRLGYLVQRWLKRGNIIVYIHDQLFLQQLFVIATRAASGVVPVQ